MLDHAKVRLLARFLQLGLGVVQSIDVGFVMLVMM
jgi:hypothetical protein